jgi:PASTA domain
MPPTFDFVVSSTNVKKARSGGWLQSGDTDYATLAINALAADNTVITRYGPVTRKLGDFGNNSSTDPQMSLTDLAVPEGGSLAISFVVVNKGGWDWDSTAINALELAGSAVLGALVQGQIVAPAATTTTTTIVNGVETVTQAETTSASLTVPEVLVAAAVIIGVLEGVNLLFPDCDGVVVPGALSLGQTELLAYADTAPWNMTVDYPGTDSPDGCGDNSDYAVTYTVANSALRVTVPNVIGMSESQAATALTAAKLTFEIGYEEIHTAQEPLPKPKVINQYPAAGSAVYVSSLVSIVVTVPQPDPHHLPQ